MICDLNSSINRLQKSTRRLQERWSVTKEQWDDPVAHQFEEEFLQPILPQLKLAMAAIHQMAQVLGDAENECEDGFRG